MRIKRDHGWRRPGRLQLPDRPAVDLGLTIEEIERDLRFGAGSRAGETASDTASLSAAPRR